MSELSKARIPDAPAIQRLPLLQLILVGLQHVLLMYGGAIAVPLIIGQAAGLSREEIAFLINADLLVAGIATIVQSLGIGPMGIRMPVMMGASFAAVGSMVAMAGMFFSGQKTFTSFAVGTMLVVDVAPQPLRIDLGGERLARGLSFCSLVTFRTATIRTSGRSDFTATPTPATAPGSPSRSRTVSCARPSPSLARGRSCSRPVPAGCR